LRRGNSNTATATGRARIASSNASTAELAGLRSYLGGPAEASTARTVFREIPNVLAINLIRNPPLDAACGSQPNPPP
jgi:hypothetical protein